MLNVFTTMNWIMVRLQLMLQYDDFMLKVLTISNACTEWRLELNCTTWQCKNQTTRRYLNNWSPTNATPNTRTNYWQSPLPGISCELFYITMKLIYDKKNIIYIYIYIYINNTEYWFNENKKCSLFSKTSGKIMSFNVLQLN